MSALFDVSLAKLDEAKMEVRRQLIEAQFAQYPDSRILTHKEMLWRWLDFTKPPFMNTYEEWSADSDNTIFLNPDDMLDGPRQYDIYVERSCARYADRVLRSIALTVQHDCVVFYECGRNDDGTYKWRGARYGIEPGDYMSGFGS